MEKDLSKYYKTLNKKVLVSLRDGKKALANGITIQETRGKKDIVCGLVEVAQPSLKISPRSLVWFPLYAALPIALNGSQYLIVDYEDIYIIENVDE